VRSGERLGSFPWRTLTKRIVGASLLFFALTSAAQAHHGKDFLLVESYYVPHPGDLYFVSSMGLARQDGSNSFEGEPSLLLGVIPRAAFELHGHIAKEGDDSFRYEATAPAIHVQLTSPEAAFPVRVGLSVEYEIASSHSEEGDRLEGRLVLEGSGKPKLAFNLIGERGEGGETTFGYAAGYRLEASERFACGAEAQGQFENSAAHELVFGVYSEPSGRCTLKGGVGAGLGPESPDSSVHAGLVWRF